jgi:hypothetical protein
VPAEEAVVEAAGAVAEPVEVVRVVEAQAEGVVVVVEEEAGLRNRR